MEKYFNLGRAYYTYLKSSTKKDQCTVSVICDNIDIKHNIMDGLLFSGAFIQVPLYMMDTKKIQTDLSLFVTETFQFMDVNCQI